MVPASVTAAFNLDNCQEIVPISSGLIHYTYKVVMADRDAYILQKLNRSVFPQPEAIQQNYNIISRHLKESGAFSLPAMVPAWNGKSFFERNGETWRCFHFVLDSYSPKTVDSAEDAYAVAFCFGRFTAGLHDLPATALNIILPRFHDLQFRFHQLEQAIHTADEKRKKEAAVLIQYAYQKQHLVDWYNKVVQQKAAYPLHILHHDCKIANILFKQNSNQIICPVDLDTTQPGLFFSDIGDMVRTIVPNLPETSTDRNALEIRPFFYKSIVRGYLDAMNDLLSEAEKKHLPFAGPVMVYMQALRFLTDYLNGDTYYQTTYAEQNWDRAFNQFKVCFLLEDFLQLT